MKTYVSTQSLENSVCVCHNGYAGEFCESTCASCLDIFEHLRYSLS